MSQTSSQSPLDDYRTQIEDWLDAGKPYRVIVQKLLVLGVVTSDRSLRRAVRRWDRVEATDFTNSSFETDGDTATITSPIRDINGIDELLIARGLEPDEWNVESTRIVEWDSASGETLKSLRVNLKRRKPSNLVLPARIEGWKNQSHPVQSTEDQRLVVLLADQHAPFHDQRVHTAVLAWLEAEAPEEGVLMGDLVDFADISRHRFDPSWSASTQRCLDSGYSLLLDYVQASPTTRWTLIEGNHEARLRNTLIDYGKDLYGLCPGSLETENTPLSGFGLAYLLRLDELGITYVGSPGTYEHTKVRLSKHLAAIHGKVATKGSGASALKALQTYGHSIAQGHSHRQSIVHKTVYDIDGRAETLLAAEVGCLCKLEGGLGYAVNSDWQQGFGAVSIWPDDRFKLDLATQIDGELYWRGERYG